MRLLAILLACLLLATPALAQEAATGECDVDELQTYYDAVDPDANASIQMLLAISGDSRTSAKFAAIEEIRAIGEAASELDYPECIEKARAWYLEGIEAMATALEAFLDDEFGTFASGYAEAMQRVGEYRGFMAALGVEVLESDGVTLFLR